MFTCKQKATRIKNEVNKVKLNTKKRRQKIADKQMHFLSKMKMMDSLSRTSVPGLNGV